MVPAFGLPLPYLVNDEFRRLGAVVDKLESDKSLAAIQGAVLNVKLKCLESWNEKRRQHAALYDHLFAGSPVKTPRIDTNNICIYHQYTVTVPERDKLQHYLADNGIGSAIFYPKPLHLQDCFANLDYHQGDIPVAEKLSDEVLSLPMYPELSPEQIEYTAKKVLEFYDKS